MQTKMTDEEEHRRLKEQLKECQLQNMNLREDIMIKKISLPDKVIKDISFWNLYDMPTYEELEERLEESIYHFMNERKMLKIERDKNRAQQDEFIMYLEDEINSCTKQNDIFFVGMQRAFELSLQKYKEIIQTKNDKSV